MFMPLIVWEQGSMHVCLISEAHALGKLRLADFSSTLHTLYTLHLQLEFLF